MRVVCADEMREMDRRASEEFGIPGLVLMEMAGRAVAEAAVEMCQPEEHQVFSSQMVALSAHAAGPPARPAAKPRIAIVCGPGNNGGDGLVSARHLANHGIEPTVLLCAQAKQLKGDAKANYDALRSRGLSVLAIEGPHQLEALSDSELIIDALYGTGLRDDIPEPARDVVAAINQAGGRVISVDIPTGISADTGKVCGDAVIADVTVTFACPKLGHVLYPGAEYCGEVLVADIGIPSVLMDVCPPRAHHVIAPHEVADRLPEREPNSHKGAFGHAGIIAGSPGLTGAAVMAVEASARAGAGLSTAAVPAALNSVLETKLTECMTFPVGRDCEVFSGVHVEEVLSASARWTAAALGCGIGRAHETIDFVQNLVPAFGKPLVIDADGLNCLSDNAVDILARALAPIIITPHPGEMARLLGTDTAWVQSNRLEAAARAADDFGVVCALKGAHTIIAEPHGRCYFNLTGTSGLAKGGTGDILTGMIAGLLAQGLEPLDAAIAGVWIHGKAGEIACHGSSPASMMATDCLPALAQVFRLLQPDPD